MDMISKGKKLGKLIHNLKLRDDVCEWNHEEDGTQDTAFTEIYFNDGNRLFINHKLPLDEQIETVESFLEPKKTVFKRSDLIYLLGTIVQMEVKEGWEDNQREAANIVKDIVKRVEQHQ